MEWSEPVHQRSWRALCRGRDQRWWGPHWDHRSLSECRNTPWGCWAQNSSKWEQAAGWTSLQHEEHVTHCLTDAEISFTRLQLETAWNTGCLINNKTLRLLSPWTFVFFFFLERTVDWNYITWQKVTSPSKVTCFWSFKKNRIMYIPLFIVSPCSRQAKILPPQKE